MRLVVPMIVLLVVAGFAAVSLQQWFRYANPEWAGHADASTASVAGTVSDRNGKPMPNVVVVWFADAGENMFRGTVRTTSAADGSYRFASLPAEAGYVAVDEGASGCEGRTGEFTPRNGFEARVDVMVTAIPTTRVVRGRLLRADGAAASPRLVQLRTSTWLTNWQGGATSGEDGSFEVVLPWVCDEVELSWASFDGKTTSAAPVRLRPGVDLELRVDDSK